MSIRALIFVGTVAAVALPSGRAAAQFLSPEAFFAGGSAENSAAIFPRDPSLPFSLTIGAQTGEVVRTVRGGEHIGDLFGGARTLYADAYLSPGRAGGGGPRLMLFSTDASESGTVTDSGKRRTDGSQHTSEVSLRAVFPLPGSGTVFFGGERATSRLDVRSDALNRLVPIFSGRPDLVWRFRRTAGVLGMTRRVGTTTLGGSISRFQAPGNLSLTQNSTSVVLPMDYSGTAWSVDVQVPLRRAAAAAHFWTDNSRGRGSGTAHRDMVSLGGSSTTRTTFRTVGGAWERTYNRAAATLTFFHSQHWSRFATVSGGLRARSLGYTDIDRAGYDLAIALDRRETGVTWGRILPHHRALTLDYRWIESPIVVGYGASGQRFLFGYRSGDEWSARNARAHRISARYALPLGRGPTPRVTIDAAQLIPLSIKSSTTNSKNGQGSTGGGDPSLSQPRHVRGGWQIGLFVTQNF